MNAACGIISSCTSTCFADILWVVRSRAQEGFYIWANAGFEYVEAAFTVSGGLEYAKDDLGKTDRWG